MQTSIWIYESFKSQIRTRLKEFILQDVENSLPLTNEEQGYIPLRSKYRYTAIAFIILHTNQRSLNTKLP